LHKHDTPYKKKPLAMLINCQTTSLFSIPPILEKMLEQYQVTRDPQESMVEFVHSKFKDTSSCKTHYDTNDV
jgi:hypothetical protein